MNNAIYVFMGPDTLVAVPTDKADDVYEIALMPTISITEGGVGAAMILLTDHVLSDEEVEEVYAEVPFEHVKLHLKVLTEAAFADMAQRQEKSATLDA